ncbi:MAG: ATP-binding domain-containing protein, partial [Bacteroidia bacterium]|nr:ATP-binding domain-containing protein [Bacteroidia bacterium]
KGLEFPNVYIVGLEEELFPSQMSMGSREDLEEERRLFYVAMTRAKQKLTLSYAENRYRWGTLNSCEPSRFISEIDPIYLEQIQSTPQFETGGWGYNKLTGNNNNSFQHFQKKKTSNTKPRNNNIVNQQLKNLKKVKDIVSNKPAVQIFDADDPSGLKTGMQVEHQKFGKGKVISLDGKADSQKATVFFQGFGQKSLLLKYAKLKII